MAKLILVKSDGVYPYLYPVSAVHYDEKTNTVTLDRDVEMKDGNRQWVAPTDCFEFDPEAMDLVNSMLDSAHNRLSAALQTVNNELRPADFVLKEEVPEELKH
jgi:hypothetical protein